MVDPFRTHFEQPNDDQLSRRLAAVRQKKWRTLVKKCGEADKATIMAPEPLAGIEDIAALQYESPESLKV